MRISRRTILTTRREKGQGLVPFLFHRSLVLCRGNVVILIMLAMPLLVGLLAIVVGMGQVAFTRARLQVAADRAAFAGASSLTHTLNEVAGENWRISHAYRELKRDFNRHTQQDRNAAAQRNARYEEARDDALSKIEAALSGMSGRARMVAEGTFAANAPLTDAAIDIQSEVLYLVDEDRDSQWEDVGYYYVEGGSSFLDPASVEDGSFRVLKYLKKRAGPDANVSIEARATVHPLVMPWLFGGVVDVAANSTAQAFGGSAERFANKETASIEDAEAQEFDDASDGLYREALIPMEGFR